MLHYTSVGEEEKLLSLSSSCGWETILNAARIRKSEKVICKAPFNGSFFEIKIRPKTKIMETNQTQNQNIIEYILLNKMELWHKRLCHVNERYLNIMKKNDLVYGLDFVTKKI